MNSKVELIDYNPKRELDLARYARISHGRRFYDALDDDADAKTISAIYRAGHFSVLEFASVAFEIECPIFVARQLMRYRTGSYIERSLRYCEPFPIDDPDDGVKKTYNSMLGAYQKEREAGVPKERARILLPLCTPTRFICKHNLRNLLHLFDERLSKAAQIETRQVVELMYDATKKVFPLVISEWRRNRG